MKTLKLTIPLTLLFAVMLSSCLFKKTGEQEPCNNPTTENYTLDATAKSKVPYTHNPAFDSLVYLSDKGDTLIFVMDKPETGWFCQDVDNGAPVCPPNHNCYEWYGANYKTVKGAGSFSFRHGKKLWISLPDNPNAASTTYPDMIDIYINNLHFPFGDSYLDGVIKYNFYDSVLINNSTYYKCLKVFHDMNVPQKGVAFYNKEYGLFYLNDSATQTNWKILKN